MSAPKYSRDATLLVHGQLEDGVEPDCVPIPGAVNAFLHRTTAICHVTSLPESQGSLFTGSPASGVSASVDTILFVDISTEADAGRCWNRAWPSWDDLFGIRDLLDLMALVVLDSPQI